MRNLDFKKIRFVTQMIMVVSVILAAFNHYLSSIGKSITWISESIFHYICPICGVTSIYQFMTSSSLFVVKVKSILGLVIGAVIILSVLFGPVICGFLCPFGAIQDLCAKIGRKILKRKYNTFVPGSIDSKLKYVRYFSLILTVILTATSGGVMILEKINPYHGFLSFFNRKFSATSIIVLILIIGLSLIIQRPWCKYICPYGAFLGLFNKIKVFRIIRKEGTCVGCRKCSKSCPMNIQVSEKDEVRDLSCISCFDCVEEKVCPKQQTIYLSSEDEMDDDSLNNKITTIS
ncbi:MAG: 4Fe-4S binding protein [Clostridium sp.]|nr:4Fe-4S binding protein [Clostridium sp.]